MSIPVDLTQLENAIAACPPGPYYLDGHPQHPFGFRYRAHGGWTSVGFGGDLHPSLVLFIFACLQSVPAVVAEVHWLRSENERLRQQAAVANGKLSAAIRAARQESE